MKWLMRATSLVRPAENQQIVQIHGANSGETSPETREQAIEMVKSWNDYNEFWWYVLIDVNDDEGVVDWTPKLFDDDFDSDLRKKKIEFLKSRGYDVSYVENYFA